MRHHRHTAWKWFKEEIARQDGCDALFAEYTRRALLDKHYNERLDAPKVIERLEARLHSGRADAAEQRRLIKRIERQKALLAMVEEEEHAD
jgi:hypothetical protein